MMGYTTSHSVLAEDEHFLVERMWSVLTQSVQSDDLTNLASLKRFIFVIEGLTIN